LNQPNFKQTENAQNIQETIKLLTKYAERVQTQAEDMEKQISQENQKIE